jgi:dihydroorotase
MNLLIKQATVADPHSPFNGQVTDIFIEDGKIVEIGAHIDSKNTNIIEAKGLQAAPGFADGFAQFGDPGYEYKETLETGANAAAAGGYTAVIVLPNTLPAVDNKAAVEYITRGSSHLPARIYPSGAITKNNAGKELAEMYDMRAAGATYFTDGTKPLQSPGILLKALQYIKAFNGVLVQLPDDQSINPGGLMNEGIISTQLGLPGKAAIAEELMVQRDIALAAYAGSSIHFTGISTARSVEYIKEAKNKGIPVTCSVTPHHLFFCDEDLQQYDTNLKMYPPLRNRTDREALKKAVLDGSIDCIASHHMPHEYDSKVLEFEYAQPGMTGLETCFSAFNTLFPGMNMNRLVELFSVNTRKIFGLETATIAKHQPANLVLVDRDKEWTPSANSFRSRCSNSAYIGKSLKGKVITTIYHAHISHT